MTPSASSRFTYSDTPGVGGLPSSTPSRQPRGLASLILASTCASLPAFAAETRRLKEQLPADVQETIDRHEAEGTTDDEAYVEATMAYYTQWVCRRQPFPDHVMSSFMNINEDVYGNHARTRMECHRQPQGLGRDIAAWRARPTRPRHLGTLR